MEIETREVVTQLFEWVQSGVSPVDISELFNEDVDFLIAGDTVHVPWIGRKVGKKGVASFYEGINQMVDSLVFEIEDLLIKNQRVIVLGHLASRVKETGKIIETEFAFDLLVKNSKIVRFRMFEDSFAVSQAVL